MTTVEARLKLAHDAVVLACEKALKLLTDAGGGPFEIVAMGAVFAPVIEALKALERAEPHPAEQRALEAEHKAMHAQGDLRDIQSAIEAANKAVLRVVEGCGASPAEVAKIVQAQTPPLLVVSRARTTQLVCGCAEKARPSDEQIEAGRIGLAFTERRKGPALRLVSCGRRTADEFAAAHGLDPDGPDGAA